MEGCRVYDDSHMTNVMLKNERIPCTSQVLDSLWCPNSSPSFHGSVSMVNFEDIRGENNTEGQLFGQIDTKAENCNEEFDDRCFHQPEKKRRLTTEQVKFLEKSFEVENKLEPDRKVQLAKELGLQPRQVAIWFQNRRARFKTKLLEKEYDSLKASYDKLKADYDTLYTDNEKLKNEVHLLSEKLPMREKGKPKQEPCDPISPLDFEPKNRLLSADNGDSDSPHYTDGNVSAVLDPSDFSQDEDDSLLQQSCFPKIEDESYDDLQPNSCNFGFPVQDQGTWFWQY